MALLPKYTAPVMVSVAVQLPKTVVWIVVVPVRQLARFVTVRIT